MTLAQTELVRAKELGYNTLGQLDYFTVDIVDREQHSIAMYLKEELKKSVERNLYVYVPLHTSQRATKYLRTSIERNENAPPMPPRQRIFMVYDPPRIVADDEKQKKKKSKITATTKMPPTASSGDAAAVPIVSTIPPVKPETPSERKQNVKRQLKSDNRAMFVFRNSIDESCEVILLPKHLFAELMASAYAASYIRESRMPPTPSMQSATLLLMFVNQPTIHFVKQLMFAQMPFIVTDFALNVAGLRLLKERSKTATWLPAPLEVARREEALVKRAIQSGSSSTSSSIGATPAMVSGNVMMDESLPSISTTISIDVSAECSDDEDDNADTGSAFATPSSLTNDERAFDDQTLIDSLNAIENDKQRTGLQQHPFVDQLHDKKWLTTRLCWFVAAFKQTFYREADACLGRKWSYVDMFYLMDQIQYVAERMPEIASSLLRRVLGTEQQFAEDPLAACMRAPSFIHQSAHDLVKKLYGHAFVNDAKSIDIVTRRVQHAIVEAVFYSESIHQYVSKLVDELQFAELLNRYQVRSTSRQRSNRALIMPMKSIQQGDIGHCMKTFVEEFALRFEEERIETIAGQSKRAGAFDLLFVLSLDAYREVSPLSIVSSVREFAPWARNGFDFLLLFTPLSYVDVNDHDQHVARQSKSPPNNTRTQEEQKAAAASSAAASSTSTSSTTPEPKKYQRGLTQTTLAPRNTLLGMQYNVWRALRAGVANTVLMQRARSANEYIQCATTNSFMRICSPLVAETLVLNKRHSLETVCGALNSFSALCGGSNCEWLAGSRRATLYANKVAELSARFCNYMVQGDPHRLFETILKPLSDRHTSLRMREINSLEDAHTDSFFSVMQLLLNGNQLPIACVDEANLTALHELVLFSDYWRTYLHQCRQGRYDTAERADDAALINNDDSATAPQKTSVVVGCSCGGATAEECESTLKQGNRCCCVCRARDSASSVDRERMSRVLNQNFAKDFFDDLCGWCRARLPLRGTHRNAVGAASTLKQTIPKKIVLTILDEADARRPEQASFTELLEILFDQVDLGRAAFADVLTVLSSLRFNLRGVPSRVAVPRGQRHSPRLFGTELSKHITSLTKTLRAYTSQLQETGNDDRPLTEQTGTRHQLHKLLKDKHLRATLENTDAMLFAKDSPQLQQPLLDGDQATLESLAVETPQGSMFFSLSLVLSTLEILALLPHQPILATFDIISSNRNGAADGAAENNDSKANLKWAMLVTLFDLLVPFRTANEVLLYYRRSCGNSFSFPLCQSVFAEATMYDDRSMHTLASNTRLPIEETLDNMLFDKHVERPATQAVQGLMEFLFINSSNIDPTARDAFLAASAATAVEVDVEEQTESTPMTPDRIMLQTTTTTSTVQTTRINSNKNDDDDDDDDKDYTGRKIAGETKAMRIEREQYEAFLKVAFAPVECDFDDDDVAESFAFGNTFNSADDDDDNAAQSNRKRKLQ